MPDRRAVLGEAVLAMGGAALVAMPRLLRAAPTPAPPPSRLPIPPGGRLSFAVVRNGTKLGTHAVSFTTTGDMLRVLIAVDLALRFGPITLYRYHPRGSEVWQGDQLAAIDSTTNDDGTRYRVSGRRTPEGFAVEGSKASRYLAPPDALPANHWNRAMLAAPFINTQDGRLMHPRVAPLGPDQIPTASGKILRASHFALTGDVRLDTWYEPSATWAGLRFAAHDGSLVRYERQDS